jgi:hypothetical protein
MADYRPVTNTPVALEPFLKVSNMRIDRTTCSFAESGNDAASGKKQQKAADALHILARDGDGLPISATATAMLHKAIKRPIVKLIESDIVDGAPRCEMAGARRVTTDGQVRVTLRAKFGGEFSDPRGQLTRLHYPRHFGQPCHPCLSGFPPRIRVNNA